MTPIVASAIQIALAYLYFCFGHAWSRVLNKYVGASFQKESRGVWKENPLFTSQEKISARMTIRVRKNRRTATVSTLTKTVS